jgi:hypothetical protein
LIPLLVHIAVSTGQAPLERIDRISCPKQEELHAYNPTRVGPTEIRYWFGGKYLQWTPMAIDFTESGPYTHVGEKRAVPQIEPIRISINQNSTNGDWTVSCVYRAQGANEGTTTLTVLAKTCALDAATSIVSCKN